VIKFGEQQHAGTKPALTALLNPCPAKPAHDRHRNKSTLQESGRLDPVGERDAVRYREAATFTPAPSQIVGRDGPCANANSAVVSAAAGLSDRFFS